MRILFLTRYDERGASSRCRVYQYLPYLASRGIDAEVATRVPAAGELWRLAGTADTVFVQKRLLTLPRLLLLRRRARVLLFDFDDALWLRRRRDYAIRVASPRTRLRLAAALRFADHVIVGNDYLGDYARRWNRRITVLPTPVDGDYYGQGGGGEGARGRPDEDVRGREGDGATGRPDKDSPALDLAGSPRCPVAPSPPLVGAGSPRRPAAPSPRRPLRLGWVGHESNLCYLRPLEPALAALARRYSGLTLRVVCSEPYESAALPIENVPWSLDEEVANLRGFDIGLMPLDDDPWTRGKCGYKALQYMAVGVPVVCSPVGMNAEIVTEGQTGLLAADLSAWERQLARLIESPGLRQQLGAAGQETALRHYSLSVMAPRLADLLAATSSKCGQ